ncbi:hypothetical protein CC86DRAFT_398159 [Ophiobolus disseminans]|uniref:SET domain-containing protein n=1 Tax=Ophiobolus disseminans TaxID=1469910 RepID=A0A6A6ZI06_9PLEO|nr:hypothetical protein CC86DRAFT_398159 [Ophiobolus disseminans]
MSGEKGSIPEVIIHRLELAKAYQQLGYPDLAAGDAYKALLLIDELSEEGEYFEEALEAAKHDCILEKVAKLAINSQSRDQSDEHDSFINWVKLEYSKTAYDTLISSLLSCNNLRTAYDYIVRAQKAYPEDPIFREYDADLAQKVRSHFDAKEEELALIDVVDYPDKGAVRREQYPWNYHEPDRFSEECLQFINSELASIAPKLEVKMSELPLLSTDLSRSQSIEEVKYVKQLGLFAKDNILPGEHILEEKSLLTAISRLHESYCDACSIALPKLQDITATDLDKAIISCEECDEVFFCSMHCHDLAQTSYHSSLCGISAEEGKVPASEAADTLYTSLLIRALALAETQDMHPLELKEIRYIWGDYHSHNLDDVWEVDAEGELVDPFGSVPQTLPFSFKLNVLAPLHLLEKMEVNIFTQSDRYDTWVFNTILAKLRGTASARQGLDGRPEISAVHPMWCLANHSCDPNVAWEWQGSIRFWTREHLVEWQGRDFSATPGIKAGEELLSHYCDIRLPVKERREWAVGPLGGECVCARCIWEEAEELRQHSTTI